MRKEEKKKQTNQSLQTMVTAHCGPLFHVTDLINLTDLGSMHLGWMHCYQGCIP